MWETSCGKRAALNNRSDRVGSVVYENFMGALSIPLGKSSRLNLLCCRRRVKAATQSARVHVLCYMLCVFDPSPPPALTAQAAADINFQPNTFPRRGNPFCRRGTNLPPHVRLALMKCTRRRQPGGTGGTSVLTYFLCAGNDIQFNAYAHTTPIDCASHTLWEMPPFHVCIVCVCVVTSALNFVVQ